ncbi:hypothetical protein TEA_029456 [Camellia sinensis var. sinensis]|uniref:UDP-glycosyltransferases domain-containing protein n=1 Tax=Camellia sinensis var. sinensis TaxID=542762 RepID=A0A4S4ETU2_CAMSN|nr:hypothetical protein TEA_029456 [Camellia sinensis var. sinensis]
MPGKLEELIENINGSDKDKITCIVADELLGWALKVAETMQIKSTFDKQWTWKFSRLLLLKDSTCLEWLDQQPANLVIYVAFGSFTVFDQIQFQEFALGLELTNKPFLWVVRPDLTDNNNDAYPKGFIKGAATRRRMVGWAPQQNVLGHPSVACFLSHCGWNSTMEGLSNGIPFLCWPYFADQFFNQSYICDVWKVELGFNCDENGIIKQGEIKNKVEQLLNDKTFKARALDLKEVVSKSAKEGGCSHNNFNNFIEWMKA